VKKGERKSGGGLRGVVGASLSSSSVSFTPKGSQKTGGKGWYEGGNLHVNGGKKLDACAGQGKEKKKKK